MRSVGIEKGGDKEGSQCLHSVISFSAVSWAEVLNLHYLKELCFGRYGENSCNLSHSVNNTITTIFSLVSFL